MGGRLKMLGQLSDLAAAPTPVERRLGERRFKQWCNFKKGLARMIGHTWAIVALQRSSFSLLVHLLCSVCGWPQHEFGHGFQSTDAETIIICTYSESSESFIVMAIRSGHFWQQAAYFVSSRVPFLEGWGQTWSQTWGRGPGRVILILRPVWIKPQGPRYKAFIIMTNTCFLCLGKKQWTLHVYFLLLNWKHIEKISGSPSGHFKWY